MELKKYSTSLLIFFTHLADDKSRSRHDVARCSRDRSLWSSPFGIVLISACLSFPSPLCWLLPWERRRWRWRHTERWTILGPVGGSSMLEELRDHLMMMIMMGMIMMMAMMIMMVMMIKPPEIKRWTLKLKDQSKEKDTRVVMLQYGSSLFHNFWTKKQVHLVNKQHFRPSIPLVHCKAHF